MSRDCHSNWVNVYWSKRCPKIFIIYCERILYIHIKTVTILFVLHNLVSLPDNWKWKNKVWNMYEWYRLIKRYRNIFDLSERCRIDTKNSIKGFAGKKIKTTLIKSAVSVINRNALMGNLMHFLHYNLFQKTKKNFREWTPVN